MNAYIIEQLRNGPGSVGETTRAYAKTFNSIQKHFTEDPHQFMNSFSLIILERVITHEKAGNPDYNHLIPFHINGRLTVHYIDRAEMDVKKKMPVSEYEDFSMIFKTDLPTMILYTMLLESNSKRVGFAASDRELLNQILMIIHQESSLCCSYQTRTTEKDFVQENLGKLKLILLDIDSSLKSYMIN